MENNEQKIIVYRLYVNDLNNFYKQHKLVKKELEKKSNAFSLQLKELNFEIDEYYLKGTATKSIINDFNIKLNSIHEKNNKLYEELKEIMKNHELKMNEFNERKKKIDNM